MAVLFQPEQFGNLDLTLKRKIASEMYAMIVLIYLIGYSPNFHPIRLL